MNMHTTTDTQLAPTDAELLGLNVGEVYFSESPSKYPEVHGTQYHAGAPGVLAFAREVLAKWGAQQVPASAAEFALSVLVAAGHVSQELVDRALALPGAPQPVARAPLTDEQIDQAIAELGLNYLADAHATNRAVLRKLCHHAHGIT